jgi:hypothetical protein
MKDRRRASRESVAWTLAFGQPEDRTPTHSYERRATLRWRRSQKAGGGSNSMGLLSGANRKSIC